MRISDQHVTARAGINACQTFFDKHQCVFLEIAQQNDFGKDAYVDLTQQGMVSGLCVALQIKSGTSYRSANGDYFLPVGQHANVWRNSTVPVFGIVYDPEKTIMYWCDLTAYLRRHPEMHKGNVPVSKEQPLNERTVFSEFIRAAEVYRTDQSKVFLALLTRIEGQSAAVRDAWILGRHDARYLILIRRLILDLGDDALRHAIVLLSHAAPHPDIFWTPHNWIPPQVEGEAQKTFQWSSNELVRLIEVVDVSDYGRGTLGQCLDVLLHEDPDITRQLFDAIGGLIQKEKTELAIRAVSLLLSHATNPSTELAAIAGQYPELKKHEWFVSIAEGIRTFGHLSLY